MKALSDSLALFMPPLWLALVAAALAAAALLVVFVDTLQENVRRGESLRQWQRVGNVRQDIGVVANATPGPLTPESRPAFSQTLSR
ncbi:MAG: hypothetical protein K9J82_11685 [Methylotenera sp.]|jgi:hypothetical protein|nr:hypothetical protein [Methylotenera sp.]